MRILSRAIAVLAAGLIGVSLTRADVSSSTLIGVVKDQTEAALPGATISVIDEARGTTVTATSDRQGSYRVPLLRPDVYTVKAELAGFRGETRKAIQLFIGREAVPDRPS